MTKSGILFYVTFFTGGGSRLFAGSFLLFVAFYTQLVHNLLFFHLFPRFHFHDDAGFPRKDIVAYIAVLECFLMLMVRKENAAFLTAV